MSKINFKIRCSAIGEIMTMPKTKKAKEAGEISQTAKTHCENWLKEKLYGRRKEIHTKELEKGLLCEEQSIDLISSFFDLGMLFKNEERKTNDFLTGEPDVLLSDTVIDIKNSFDCFTFPLFSQKIDITYWWQLQGYMILFNKPKAKLVYTLMDLPEDLMLTEIFKGTAQGKEEEEIRKFHTYSDLHNNLRIKVFSFEKDKTAEEKIKERVKACQKYIDSITIKF